MRSMSHLERSPRRTAGPCLLQAAADQSGDHRGHCHQPVEQHAMPIGLDSNGNRSWTFDRWWQACRIPWSRYGVHLLFNGGLRPSTTRAMATTGKRFQDRTHDRTLDKVLDARTKAVLSTVLREPRGQAVKAYLLARTTSSKVWIL